MGNLQEIKADAILMGAVGLLLFVSIFIPKLLKERGIISSYTARKIVHSLAGLSVFSVPYLYYPVVACVVSCVMTIMTRFSGRSSKAKVLRDLFDAIGEEEEIEAGYLQGPFSYCLSITILVSIFLFFPDKYSLAISAILIMMFADPLAAIVGKRYGKYALHVPWVGSKRTLEGSLTFFVASLVICLFTFYLLGMVLPGRSTALTAESILLFSLVMSVVAPLLELMSPSKYDDLIVPLGTTGVVSFLAIALGLW